MRFLDTNGLATTDIRPKGSVPIYFTDNWDVIEGPTYWAMDLAKKRSKSVETLKQYTTNLARFLQWRDMEGYKAEYWQHTDKDVIYSYIEYLKEERDEYGRPQDPTIENYIAQLGYFFKWAEDKYKHYWKMDLHDITVKISDNSTMVTNSIEVEAREFHLQNGRSTHVDQEFDKFIHRENIDIIVRLFDDVVYSIIVYVLFRTGLRTKEFFQLPYRGEGLNAGLKRYHEVEIKNLSPIRFEFESKGKRRSIKIPPDLWALICREWMPERAKRAEIYRRKHGCMPPNSALFLTKNGNIVTKRMLARNLERVALKVECPEKKLTPHMFRHTFATYFVLDRLTALNVLGKPYEYNAAIDAELREWMGHSLTETTYKYYVHLVNRYFYGELLEFLENPVNKKIIDAITEMSHRKSEPTNLCIMVGIPGSGKSSLAETMTKENPNLRVISSDDIRDELRKKLDASFDHRIVFEEMEKRLKSLLEQGNDIVVDATNLEVAYRNDYIKIGHSLGATVIALILNTDYKLCLERNLNRKDKKKKVPIDTMAVMYEKFKSTIQFLEGFDKVEYI